MSNYQDIYRDLPSRVFKVWQRTKTHPDNETEDLSVTATLMAAAAGFASPFENIRYPDAAKSDYWKDHPAFDQVCKEQYRKDLAHFDGVLKEKLASSVFFAQGGAIQDLRLAHGKKLKDVQDIAEKSSTADLDLNTQDVRFAMTILRNALAHNNIFAFSGDEKQIERLAFFSKNYQGQAPKKPKDGWDVLIISVGSFETLLNSWFDLVKVPGAQLALSQALEMPDADLLAQDQPCELHEPS